MSDMITTFFNNFYVFLVATFSIKKYKTFSGQFSSLNIDLDTVDRDVFVPPSHQEIDEYEALVRCSCDTDNDDQCTAEELLDEKPVFVSYSF